MNARIIRQADIARELNTGEMTVHRLAKSLHRNGAPLSDIDVITMLSVGELKTIGLHHAIAVELLVESSPQVRYLAQDRRNRCWIIFVETTDSSFRVPCLSPSHFESVLDCFPLSLVLPLHEIIARASDRLTLMKAKRKHLHDTHH